MCGYSLTVTENLGAGKDFLFLHGLVLFKILQMKSFNSHQLLEELQADVRQLVLTATYLQQEDPEILLTAPAVDRWSVVQVLEHLNSYGRYYLPAIEKSLQVNKEHKEKFTA